MSQQNNFKGLWKSIGMLFTLTLVLLVACTPATKPKERVTFKDPLTDKNENVYLISADGNTDTLSAVEVEALSTTAFTSRFTLIDRTALDLALVEAGKAMRDLVDPDTAAEIGKALSAKLSITVSSKTEKDNKIPFTKTIKTQVNLRLTNIETGVVMASVVGESTKVVVVVGDASASEALSEATQRAIDKLLTVYVGL